MVRAYFTSRVSLIVLQLQNFLIRTISFAQSEESQSMKLKILGEQFEAEMKSKTLQIKPKLIGCVWQGLDNEYSASGECKEFSLSLSLEQIETNRSAIFFSVSAPARSVEFVRAREAYVNQLPMIVRGTPTHKVKARKVVPSPVPVVVQQCNNMLFFSPLKW